jgi:hypothetical protein
VCEKSVVKLNKRFFIAKHKLKKVPKNLQVLTFLTIHLQSRLFQRKTKNCDKTNNNKKMVTPDAPDAPDSREKGEGRSEREEKRECR